MAVLASSGWAPAISSAAGALAAPKPYAPPGTGSNDYVWVEILDKNLVSQGPVQFVSMTAQLYYNAVGSWTITVPYSDFLWKIMMAGDFFVNVNWRGLFMFGGKCENPGYSDSIPGASGSGTTSGPYITLSGADWLGLIANRIAYPSPGSPWSGQVSTGSDVIGGGKLETAIKSYVNDNCGPGALSSRRIANMTIATDLARGATVSYSVKFGSGVNLNLLDIIRILIAQSGNGNAMGVRITRNASTHGLVFDVYIPRNLSGKAWFSRDLGNLTAIQFSLTDPTVTDALIQGASTFIQRTASGVTSYNKVEVFNDSSSETDVNNLNATAQQAILSGAAGPTLTATLADTPFLTFGRDFGLGDIVTIEVRPGNTYSDVITGVTLTADPSQTPSISAVPTVGQNANATATDQSVIGQLTARIKALEKKLATKG